MCNESVYEHHNQLFNEIQILLKIWVITANIILIQAAKICNNMLLAIGMIGTSETMNLGIRWKLSWSQITAYAVILNHDNMQQQQYTLCK